MLSSSSLLRLSLCRWNVYAGIMNYLPDITKMKLMKHTGNGGLQSLKVNVRPSLVVVECNFG